MARYPSASSNTNPQTGLASYESVEPAIRDAPTPGGRDLQAGIPGFIAPRFSSQAVHRDFSIGKARP